MRLSIDLGYSSIGWSLFALDAETGAPNRIINLGSLIFDNGRNYKGVPNSVGRRQHRQARRQLQRTKQRKQKLIKDLVSFGLLPADKQERKALNRLDPYKLRDRAARSGEELSPHEFGRLLIHLSQRRGFKSNRKTPSDDEGAIKSGVAALEEELLKSGCTTVGQYFACLRDSKHPVRMRPTRVGAKDHFEIFLSRDMVEREFDVVWENQAAHLRLTDEQKQVIRHDIFWQRPLKPVEPGRCSADPDEPRARTASILFQRYRLLSDLNNLCIIDADGKRHLDAEERDILYRKLLTVKEQSFDRIRALLKTDALFNFESDSNKAIKGCEIAGALGAEKCFGKRWRKFSQEIQQQIVDRLLEEEDEENLITWLVEQMECTHEQAEAISRAKLPSGYGAFSVKVLSEIVPLMEKKTVWDEEGGVERYLRADEALLRRGYTPGSAKRTPGGLKSLPYYGELLSHRTGTGSGEPQDPPEIRYGKIANPSVHIALNQIRKLVNDIIDRYGRPREIVVELSRDPFKGPKLKGEIKKSQDKNRERRDKIVERLINANVSPTPVAIKRYRLWEELNPNDESDRLCVYTGTRITFQMAMSETTQIDHIIPRSRSLDNSMSNLILCTSQANQFKKNRTPYEVWGSGSEWAGIAERSRRLPSSKAKRVVATSASDLMIDEHLPDRMLNDTRYTAKIAREYLSHLCASPEDIWCTNGNLTSLLRHRWSLDDILGDGRKNRNDHRHHAIDAVVIGLTDKSMIERAAAVAQIEEENSTKGMFRDLPMPWEGFHEEVEAAISKMVVYHKPDHGVDGQLVGGSHYGKPRSPHPEHADDLVKRANLDDLTKSQIERIKDDRIRETLLSLVDNALKKVVATDEKEANKKKKEAIKRSIQEFRKLDPEFAKIRRVQLYETKKTAITVGPAHGQRILVPDGNHRIELWELADGGRNVFAITLLDAAKGVGVTANRPQGGLIPTRKLLTLHKNDVFRYHDPDGSLRYMRVLRLNPTNKRIWAIDHYEAGDLTARNKDPDDHFKMIQISFTQIEEGLVQRVWLRPSGIVGARAAAA